MPRHSHRRARGPDDQTSSVVVKVDAYSSLSHYSAHIRPIWEALPPSLRGGWWTPANLPRSERLTVVASYRDAQTIGRPYVLVEHGAGQTYTGHERNGSYPGGEGHDRCVLFLCPSERVAGLWRERYPDTPAVVVGCPRLDRYAERLVGVEQLVARRPHKPQVVGSSPTPATGREADQYPHEGNDQRGSNRPEGVSVSQRTARAGAAVTHGPPWDQSERATGALVTGQSQSDLRSSPPRRGDGVLVPPPSRLDRYDGERREAVSSGARRPPSLARPGPDTSPGLPTIALTFHADLAVCPETHSAWRYYDPHLPRLVRDPRFRVVGHGHPRLWPTIRRRWEELGVDQWPDVDQVLSEADVLVADNTSVLYEACAFGIPTVCLNLPSYRRDTEHGGRFWSAPPGIQCDHPSELADTICRALADPPAHRAIRARAVEWAYGGPIRGDASERAAAAIMEVLSGL